MAEPGASIQRQTTPRTSRRSTDAWHPWVDCLPVLSRTRSLCTKWLRALVGAVLVAALIACNSPEPMNDHSSNTAPSNSRPRQSPVGRIKLPPGVPPAGYRLLSGDEIRSRVAGKVLTPDEDAGQLHLPFSEAFRPNQSWSHRREYRGPILYFGRWFVAGDRLCVSTRERPSVCRQVWSDAARQRLAMEDIFSPFENIVIMISVER